MRFKCLTSIRGVASLIVVLYHVLNVYDVPRFASGTLSLWLFQALSASLNGQAAVELFFVLSGCVLALSLVANGKSIAPPRQTNWIAAFYIRRVFRIYPALWLSIIVSLALFNFIRAACDSGLCTDWASTAFPAQILLAEVVLAFVSIYVGFNGPMWSLRVELLFSLLFPLIFLGIRGPRTRWLTLAFLALIAFAPIPRAYALHYGLAFGLGALIPMLQRSKALAAPMTLALATFALIYDRTLLGVGDEVSERLELVEIFIAFFVVYGVFFAARPIRILEGPVIHYLGEISYGIYILHFPLLFALTWGNERIVGPETIAQYPVLATSMLGALTLLLTIIFSAASYHFVERPMHSAGRILALRISSRQRSCALPTVNIAESPSEDFIRDYKAF
jgi:peptidoglycan/LPS O-acetylase OafA/YrhL